MQWILYSIIRVAIFIGVFAILMLLRLDLWLAGIAAAIISLCISFIFIKQPQATPRAAKPDTDAADEDAALEGDRGSEAKPE